EHDRLPRQGQPGNWWLALPLCPNRGRELGLGRRKNTLTGRELGARTRDRGARGNNDDLPGHPLTMEGAHVAVGAWRGRARQVERELGLRGQPTTVVVRLLAREVRLRDLRARRLGGGHPCIEETGIRGRLDRVAGASRQQ